MRYTRFFRKTQIVACVKMVEEIVYSYNIPGMSNWFIAAKRPTFALDQNTCYAKLLQEILASFCDSFAHPNAINQRTYDIVILYLRRFASIDF